MEQLQINSLKKNKQAIKECFQVVKDKTLTNRDLYVLIPELYLDKNLAKIDTEVETVCIFAIVDDRNNYGVTVAPIKQKFLPDRISKVNINDVIYRKFEFSKGSVFFGDNKATMTQSFLYDLFETFFLLGKIPWYIGYEELSDLLLETKKYNGSSIGNDPMIVQLLTSIITRVKGDESEYLRHVLRTKADLNKYKITYKGLNDVYYSLDSTSSKIIGGYLEDGMINAIMDPSKNITPIEKILTK